MKKIKSTFVVLLTLLTVNLLFVSCSNDEQSDEQKQEFKENLLAEKALINASEFIISSKSKENCRGTEMGADYFTELAEHFREVQNSELIMNKSQFRARASELYIEGLFEYVDDIEYVANFVKSNIINDSMNDLEREMAVIEYVENTFQSDRLGGPSGMSGDYGTCKRRERNCNIQVVAAGVLGHLACAATADSATIASFGLTAAASVICHSAVAAAQYAGHDNCYLDFQDCIKS